MALSVYNSLSRQKERFEPLTPASNVERPPVKMYVCGVTVYDFCHLGHARTYIVWDVVRRYLEWRGYDVTYVQNFTDVDDKIVKRARQEQSSMREVSERYIEAYFEDMERLNVRSADVYPRATRSLEAIYRLVRDLELKAFAYRVRGQADGEDVYYSVRNFAEYGKLSGRKLEDMQAGASGRVGSEETSKREPFDFALWKSVGENEEGFDSPWGRGRPGWHIECSAMVRDTLGDRIDIHAGGADLTFPHHENEIAQSEPITGKPFAKYWLHNGFLNIDGEKMSKSLGNFTTIRDCLETRSPMALRLFFLQTHYRSPIDLTDDSLTAAENGWQTLNRAIAFAESLTPNESTPDPEAIAAFQRSMDDDFNTPSGLAVAFDLAKTLNKEKNLQTHQGQGELERPSLLAKANALLSITDILGLASSVPDADSNNAIGDEGGISVAEIEDLLVQRREARQAKQFQIADEIRDRLTALGITIVDRADGTSHWTRSD
ncbi:MAG: cysteine--tRNA ligase [Cyanobacteria bacterium P01_F01_bin.33]